MLSNYSYAVTMKSMDDYQRINGVTMRPGTAVYVCDRDDPNYDHEGTIVSVNFNEYTVPFGESRSTRRKYSIDQIMPSDTNTAEARQWRASRQLKVFLCEPCPIPTRLSKWQAVSLFADGGRDRLVAVSESLRMTDSIGRSN